MIYSFPANKFSFPTYFVTYTKVPTYGENSSYINLYDWNCKSCNPCMLLEVSDLCPYEEEHPWFKSGGTIRAWCHRSPLWSDSAETAFLSTIPVLITPGTPAAATLMEGPAESDSSLWAQSNIHSHTDCPWCNCPGSQCSGFAFNYQ